MARNFDRRSSAKPTPGNQKTGQAGVGVTWYHPHTYAQCLSFFEDAKEFPESYEAWLKIGEETEARLIHQGYKVVRAHIDPATFPAWCFANGYTKIDGKTRSAWSSEFARKTFAPSGS